MEVTVSQLEDLLFEQKAICRNEFQKIWDESRMKQELLKIDGGDKIAMMIHEVRDDILNSKFPSEFLVIKKIFTLTQTT